MIRPNSNDFNPPLFNQKLRMVGHKGIRPPYKAERKGKIRGRLEISSYDNHCVSILIKRFK